MIYFRNKANPNLCVSIHRLPGIDPAMANLLLIMYEKWLISLIDLDQIFPEWSSEDDAAPPRPDFPKTGVMPCNEGV